MVSQNKTIAILGAGPVGLEAAHHALGLGYDVQVYERGRIGENVRRWGHVRLFSPWKLNRSESGLAVLRRAGIRPEPDDACPTGAEYVERYLDPLARDARIQGRVHEQTAVVQVGRERIDKLDFAGDARERFPFRILLDTPNGERIAQADVLIDCSGTYGHHNWMGSGGIPALGEREHEERIGYLLEDVAGSERARYRDRRILLVGAGYSAATALDALVAVEGTSVIWAVRGAAGEPIPVVADDPLPDRDRLARRANALARSADARVSCLRSSVVHAVRADGDGFEVELDTDGESTTIRIDWILAHVGYGPDRAIHRELQVHECYASLGPMKLAATLLNADAADCLSAPASGAGTLLNPEPDFFILGAKSYGRYSHFLIRTGLQQVHDALSLIDRRRVEEDPCRPASNP